MRRRTKHGRIIALPVLCWAIAINLFACAQMPEPEETIDSLTAVIDPGQRSSSVEELPAAPHPTPRVEPLGCTPYLVVTARGTSEPPRGQLLSPVARAIALSRPEQVRTLDLGYPADDNVNEGGALGVHLLIETLNVQTSTCSTQRFVLLGYSQGALIVGDALVPPDARLVGAAAGELSQAAADRVLAVVLYGNPRFSPGEPFNTGDFSDHLSGLLPRPISSLQRYEDRLRDYCTATDFVCQSSGFELDPEGHMAYFHNGMQQDGAAFAISSLEPLGGFSEDVSEDNGESPEAD